MSTVDYISEVAEVYLLPIGLRIVVALIIFYLGRTVARALMRAFDRVMDRSTVDVSLRKFLRDVIYATLIVAVAIAALDTVGVKTTAVIAVLGAAGLAVGLALQGSLSNFAAGVMLIILRPYKVGDLVVIGKYLGRIDAIKVFQTVLITADNREITIPNGQIIGAPIENLTALGKRRVDLVVTVPTPELVKMKQLLEGIVKADQRVAAAPPPAIDLAEVTEQSCKLTVRPWTATEHYAAVAADAMDRIKVAMEGAGGAKYSVTLSPSA
jgi:small conductance mechanosensitive channel